DLAAVGNSCIVGTQAGTGEAEQGIVAVAREVGLDATRNGIAEIIGALAEEGEAVQRDRGPAVERILRDLAIGMILAPGHARIFIAEQRAIVLVGAAGARCSGERT